MIARDITEKLKYLATKYPVVTLTGVRQCGKSYLLKNTFPDYQYISLEDTDYRRIAVEDPRGFLNNFGEHLIIDEAQYAPNLFSYIQTKVDEKNECGMYILSGSQNFLLIEKISQSLAGRVAVLKLFPLSVNEMQGAGIMQNNLNEWLYTGGYPRIYDKEIEPTDFYPYYIQTYMERDVQTLRNIGNLLTFHKFLKLCAARVGQLLNINSLANECGISVPTVQAWLSILEASYIVFLLQPYHKNFNKRLIKSPKLYFYDTGVLSSLLGMTNAEQMATHYLRGEIFENMVIADCVKNHYAQGKTPQIYFWRDSNQNEVDLLVENGLALQAYEIKSSATINSDFLNGLKNFRKTADLPQENTAVIYGGDINFRTTSGFFVSWKKVWKND